MPRAGRGNGVSSGMRERHQEGKCQRTSSRLEEVEALTPDFKVGFRAPTFPRPGGQKSCVVGPTRGESDLGDLGDLGQIGDPGQITFSLGPRFPRAVSGRSRGLLLGLLGASAGRCRFRGLENVARWHRAAGRGGGREAGDGIGWRRGSGARGLAATERAGQNYKRRGGGVQQSAYLVCQPAWLARGGRG